MPRDQEFSQQGSLYPLYPWRELGGLAQAEFPRGAIQGSLPCLASLLTSTGHHLVLEPPMDSLPLN